MRLRPVLSASAVHWLAGSEKDVNFGCTSLAAPKATSSNVSRYSRSARGAASTSIRVGSNSSFGAEYRRFASASIKLPSTSIRWPLQEISQNTVSGKLRLGIQDRMRAHFALIEAALAEHEGAWILGDDLSVCDFYLAGCARWSQIAPRHAPLEPRAIHKHPRVKDLLERLEARDSVIRAFDAEDTPRSAYFLEPVRSRHTQTL